MKMWRTETSIQRLGLTVAMATTYHNERRVRGVGHFGYVSLQCLMLECCCVNCGGNDFIKSKRRIFNRKKIFVLKLVDEDLSFKLKGTFSSILSQLVIFRQQPHCNCKNALAWFMNTHIISIPPAPQSVLPSPNICCRELKLASFVLLSDVPWAIYRDYAIV